jgi:predicted nucleic acid-binding protein
LNVILDASSSINLYRGGVLEVVLKLTSFGFIFHVGSIVRSECGDLSEFLDLQAAMGNLVILPDDTLSVLGFSEILSLYDLGLGETECIALAHQRNSCVCTDDKSARKAAVQHLGAERALGSLRLLRNCVCQGLIGPPEAVIAYELMKSRGAFLPSISVDYFDC